MPISFIFYLKFSVKNMNNDNTKEVKRFKRIKNTSKIREGGILRQLK